MHHFKYFLKCQRNLFAKTILLAFLICLSILTNGQVWTGISAGINLNRVVTNNSDEPYKIKQELGINYNVYINVPLKKWLTLEFSPGIMHKNYTLNGTGILSSVHHTFNNKYINLPFILQPNIKLKSTELYCDIGFYGSYWFSGIIKGYAPNVFNSTYSISSNIIEERVQLEHYNSVYDFNKEKDNRTEYGYIIGIGANYCIKDTIKLFFKIDLWESLTDQQKKNTLFHTPRYNESIVASLGIFVHF